MGRLTIGEGGFPYIPIGDGGIDGRLRGHQGGMGDGGRNEQGLGGQEDLSHEGKGAFGGGIELIAAVLGWRGAHGVCWV